MKKKKTVQNVKSMRLIVIVLTLLFSFLSKQGQALDWGNTSENLRDVAATIAKDLAEDWKKSKQTKKRKPFVHISRNYFSDPNDGSNYPFSSFLVSELRHALTNTGAFDVRDQFSQDHDLMIVGEYYRERGTLIILTRLLNYQEEDGSIGSSRQELDEKYWSKKWFVEDVEGKMFFLLKKLEKKYIKDLGGQLLSDTKMSVLIEPLNYQNTKLYSPFSDFASQYIPDFLTESHFLTPKISIAKELEKASKHRTIVPVSTTASKGGTVATIMGANAVFSGSYWRIGKGQLEIKASLATNRGDVSASGSIRFPESLVSSEMLQLPQTKDKKFIKDLTIPEIKDSGFHITLITDRGRSNLSYRLNQTMTFYVKVNRPAYVRLFNRGADGAVYQIYPNDFSQHQGPVIPQELVSIPGKNENGFEFKVHEPLGNELVKAYASDKPLPDLPGQDVGYGFKKMDLNIQQIQNRYVDYAISRGVRLSQDVLSIVTKP